MKTIRLTALMVAAAMAVWAQSPTGRWMAKASSDDEVREIIVALAVAPDGSVSGYIQAPQYEDRIIEGSFKDGKVAFVGERDANNNTKQKRNYTAVVEAGKLKLTFPPRNNQAPQVMEFTRLSSETPKPLPAAPPKISAGAYTPVKYNGLAKTPPMGWNSWNKFAGKVNDKVVREVADAMVSTGMRDAGYVYVNIDDTWESTRDAKGNILTNSKFPDMKKLADYIHGKGLKLGDLFLAGTEDVRGLRGQLSA